jgi:uncharacterized protein
MTTWHEITGSGAQRAPAADAIRQDAPDDPAIRELLTAVSTMTLATVDPQGEAHASPVFFAADDNGRLYFFSDVTSAHARYAERSSRIAAAIHRETHDPDAIHGLQIHGLMRRVEQGADRDRAWSAYRERFPFIHRYASLVNRSALFVIEPDWIRLVDNRRGFGFKREWARRRDSAGEPTPPFGPRTSSERA